jgi:hypothetical protein
MSKLITSALIATFLLSGGFQTAANAHPGDGTGRDGSANDREYVCKVLQRNCT